MIVPRPATTAERLPVGQCAATKNAFKHVRAHGEANFANLSSENLKALWSRPRSCALRGGRRGRPESPSASPLFPGLRRKSPASTATSPPRSGRSLHLEGGDALSRRPASHLLLTPLPNASRRSFFTLLELQVPSFHHANFAVVDRTGRFCSDGIYRVLKKYIYMYFFFFIYKKDGACTASYRCLCL